MITCEQHCNGLEKVGELKRPYALASRWSASGWCVVTALKDWHSWSGHWREAQESQRTCGRKLCLPPHDSPSFKATMTRERCWRRRAWHCSGSLETEEVSRSPSIDLAWLPGDEAILEQRVS